MFDRKRDTKGLASLPDQTILKIFSYLDAASLGRSAQVNWSNPVVLSLYT